MSQQEKLIGYKLFHVRKNLTIGPLFINKKQVIPLGEWLKAEAHRTPKFVFRPGWHICSKPEAPHIKTDCKAQKRAWYKVEFFDYKVIKRPECQGGIWYIAKNIRVVEKYVDNKIDYMSLYGPDSMYNQEYKY